MNIVLNRHTEFVSRSSRERELLSRLLADPLFRYLPPEGAFLADIPIGRFLLGIFGPRATLFEAALQHYGYPTLNLDVIYSPLVALYFATHTFQVQESGALLPKPKHEGGLVYVMGLPDEGLKLDGEPMGQLALKGRIAATRPRIADLFALSFDNDSRPRRQYGALLAELTVLYWDGKAYRLPDGVQCNSYASWVRHRIRLSRHFWDDPATHRFLGANLGAWFFPGPDVDLLLQELRSAEPGAFPVYDVAERTLRHPLSQFEFLRRWRIVLTGKDAPTVRGLLASSWHQHSGWIEVLPLAQVMTIASDIQQRELLDVVVACENDQAESHNLKEMILDQGRRAGRTFVALASLVRGDAQTPRARVYTVGGEVWVDFDDPYSSSLQYQRAFFDAIIYLSRLRYEKHMRPEPPKWESFIEFAGHG